MKDELKSKVPADGFVFASTLQDTKLNHVHIALGRIWPKCHRNDDVGKADLNGIIEKDISAELSE